jgi:hypothetical protein
VGESEGQEVSEPAAKSLGLGLVVLGVVLLIHLIATRRKK